jgi:hypothetical protein
MTKIDSSRVTSYVESEQKKCQGRKAKFFPIKIIKSTDKKTSVETKFMWRLKSKGEGIVRGGADKSLAWQEVYKLQRPCSGFIQLTTHEAQYTS